MVLQKTEFDGIVIMSQQVHQDARGYVLEQYKQNEFEQEVQSVKFVQDYEFRVAKNAVRGLHYQNPPYSQSMIVRCVSGAIVCLALDLRIGSKTYGKCLQTELNADNKLSMFIPQGFAHGFVSLHDNTIVQYKFDNYINDDALRGINIFDPALNITLPFDAKESVVNEVDSKLQMLKDVQSPFNI